MTMVGNEYDDLEDADQFLEDMFPDVDPPRTEEQLQQLRSRFIKLARDMDSMIVEFTCDDCGFRDRCPLVYDLYNTDGDCLMDK